MRGVSQGVACFLAPCDHITQRISMNSELDDAEKFLFLSIDFKVHPRKSKNLIYLTIFANRERYKRKYWAT